MRLNWNSLSDIWHCKDTIEGKELNILITSWSNVRENEKPFFDVKIDIGNGDIFWECEIFKEDLLLSQLLNLCQGLTKLWRDQVISLRTSKRSKSNTNIERKSFIFSIEDIDKCCNKAFGKCDYNIFLRKGYQNPEILQYKKSISSHLVSIFNQLRRTNTIETSSVPMPLLTWPGTRSDNLL